MFLFSQMVGEVETRELMGQSCVGFTCAVIFMNLIVMITMSIKAVILKIRLCCAKRRAK